MATTNGTDGTKVSNGAKPVVRTEPVPLSVALAPCDLPAVPDLVGDIARLSCSVSNGKDESRLALLAKARSLVHALETPRETMIKHNWAQTGLHAAITIGVDCGLFHLMARDGGKARKVDDLATELGVDPALLKRLMRHIAAMGYITETGQDEYKSTNFSKSLTIPIIGDGYPCIAGVVTGATGNAPEYFREKGYNNPSDATDSPFQYGYKTKQNMFEYMQEHPPYGQQFNHHMGGYRQGRPAWMDAGFFPVKERLVEGFDATIESGGTGADKGPALLVDVGGGLGHDLDEFRRKHADAPGRLILEDLPGVIDQIQELDAKIERVGHDFLTPQPIKGARAYYMHSVLHDWPDEIGAKILANITAAMKPGYSKLLINENVIPSTDADWQATALDMMMLTLFSSRERTRDDWYELLEGAGLKIIKIWCPQNGVESLIECELA